MTRTNCDIMRTSAIWMAGASALALSSGGAFAQDEAERPEGAIELDVIEVYGEALSLQRAIDVKRNSVNILDATVQDDIGRLPDLNTAAVIRRINGVAVQNDQAEARFPIVRGLNPTFNRTTIDGGVVSSPERGGFGRAVPLDVIPASLLSRLEVVKSVTPELDGNAIGGTINVVTRSAYDQDDPFFFGAGFIGFHEQAGDGGTLDGDKRAQPWRLNFAGGTQFGPNDQFGVVLGFDYSIRNFEIPQVEVDDADYTEFDALGNNVGLGAGNGFVVPTNNRIFFYNNTRERIGGSAKFEWRPSETLQASVSGLYTEFNDDERRDEFRYELGTGGGSNQPATITQQTPISGVTAEGFGISGLGRFTLDRQIYNIQGDVEWRPAEALTLDARVTYSAAELDNPESTEAFQTDTSFGAFYDTSDFFPRTFPLDPVGFFDPASYAFQNRGELDRFVDDDILEVAANAEFEGDGFKLKVGGQFRDREKDEGFTFRRFVADPALGYTLANAVDNGLTDVEFQGNYDFLFRVDSAAANQFFEDNQQGFTQSLLVNNGTTASEEVYAGYVQGMIEFPRGSVVGGLRVEHTSWEGGPDGGERVSGDYTNFLPSAVAQYEVVDDVLVRLAASRTLGRPDLNDLTQGLNIDAANMAASRSNPDLDPRISTNVDLSVEWYVPDGIFSVGAFYKDINNEIFTLTTEDVSLFIGEDEITTLTQPENASSAEIFGIEAQYQQVLSFLPAPWNGLGFGGNVTWLDTEFEIPLADGGTRTRGLFQQPDLTYNVTAFYANEFFEVRASYNYTGDFLDTINQNNPDRDEFWDSRGQLDAQARVTVRKNVNLVFEAVNLTDAGRTELTGPGQAFLQEDARFGRTFWLGVNVAY